MDWIFGRSATPLAICATVFVFALCGCAHRAPASIHDDTVLISGHNTVHATARDAVHTVLVEAAAITLDHGYRYFRLMTPVRPGADITVRLYGAGDIDSAPANLYDADDVAAGNMRPMR